MFKSNIIVRRMMQYYRGIIEMTGPENHGNSFDANQKRTTESWKSKEKGMKREERMGGGVHSKAENTGGQK